MRTVISGRLGIVARLRQASGLVPRLCPVLAAVWLIAVAGYATAAVPSAPPLKVYISADMEGVAGLTANSQFAEGGRDYPIARRLMVAEVNAAIAGAYDAGATEVVVNDAHGSEMNIVPDELDQRASLITGSPKPFGMMEGIDRGFAAAIFIGYHARSSTAAAVMDHSFSGNLKSIRINGREVGEFGLNAALAGFYNVPVVFVSGDAALTREAEQFSPEIVTVAVKEAIGTTAAVTLHPTVARERIRAGVAQAIQRRRDVPAGRDAGRILLQVELLRASQADLAIRIPGVERESPRVVRFDARDIVSAYRMVDLIVLLASLDHL
jgi:D-amino peptidase